MFYLFLIWECIEKSIQNSIIKNMWNEDLYKIGIVLDINEIEDYQKVFLFDIRLLLQENKPREELLEEQSVFILPLLTSCDRAIGHALIGNLFYLI